MRWNTLALFHPTIIGNLIYDDGAKYEGTVCGNTFKYSGGTDTYTESGTFILGSNGMASKTSEYASTIDSYRSSCSDPVLTRYTTPN